jgi:hypothetical protein
MRARALPVLLSIALVVPNNPFVAAAAAQSMSAAESAANSGSLGGNAAAVSAVGAGAAAPVPLSLTVQALSAPITAASLIPAPTTVMADAGPKLAAAPALAPAAAAALPVHANPARAASREIASAAMPASPLALPAAAAALSGSRAASDGPAAAADFHSGAFHPGADRAAKPGDDAGRTSAADAAANPSFDGAQTRSGDPTVFIVSHGRAPISTKLSALGDVLKAQPELAASLNKNGNVRLVLGGAAGQDMTASPEFKAKYPMALGLPEVSPVKQAWSGVVGNPLVKLALYPFKVLLGKAPLPKFSLKALASLPGRAWKEARFLGRTFADSASKPLPSEVVGGIATKSFPLVTSIGVYWATVGLAHPWAMAGLMALSLSQEVFHGIFLNTWNNFQDGLSRMRGFAYQMNFNLLYMQGFGAMYRALSWTANPHKTIPPWSPFYWQDVMVMSLVGTFFGTLGFNGLNTLYAKGRLKRWQRSGIQQLRDVMFLLAGPFFATGSMHAFWALFIFQQSLDLTIALLAWRARTRATLYVVPEGGSRPEDAEALTRAVRAGGVAAPVNVEKLSTEKAR